jgi:hypothetical protein
VLVVDKVQAKYKATDNKEASHKPPNIGRFIPHMDPAAPWLVDTHGQYIIWVSNNLWHLWQAPPTARKKRKAVH